MDTLKRLRSNHNRALKSMDKLEAAANKFLDIQDALSADLGNIQDQIWELEQEAENKKNAERQRKLDEQATPERIGLKRGKTVITRPRKVDTKNFSSAYFTRVNKTVKELQAEARALGVKGFSRMSKTNLIHAILDAKGKSSK